MLVLVGMLREEVLLLDAHHWTQQHEEFLCGFVLVLAFGGNRWIVRSTLYHWAGLSLHLLDIYHPIVDYWFRSGQSEAYWSEMIFIVSFLYLMGRLSRHLSLFRLVLGDWRSGGIAQSEMCLLVSLLKLSCRFNRPTLFLLRLVFRDRRSGRIPHRKQQAGRFVSDVVLLADFFFEEYFVEAVPQFLERLEIIEIDAFQNFLVPLQLNQHYMPEVFIQYLDDLKHLPFVDILDDSRALILEFLVVIAVILIVLLDGRLVGQLNGPGYYSLQQFLLLFTVLSILLRTNQRLDYLSYFLTSRLNPFLDGEQLGFKESQFVRNVRISKELLSIENLKVAHLAEIQVDFAQTQEPFPCGIHDFLQQLHVTIKIINIKWSDPHLPINPHPTSIHLI